MFGVPAKASFIPLKLTNMAAYSSYHYTLEVLSPVFIGGVKENDYTLGEDYFYKEGSAEIIYQSSVQ